MKPNKIRRFCPDCGRVKAVFDTEKAAKMFIEYNGDDIMANGGYVPTRVYYCDLCCGWHVTSRKNYEHKSLARLTVDTVMQRNREKEQKKKEKARQRENREKEKIQQTSEAPSTKQQKPSVSRTWIFLKKVMVLSVISVQKARYGNFDEAQAACRSIDRAIEEYKNAIGAPSLRKRFLEIYEELKMAAYQVGAPTESKMENLKQQLHDLRKLCPELFTFNKEEEDEPILGISPEQIQELMFIQENVKTEKPSKPKSLPKIKAHISSAKLSILYEDYDDAKTELLKAIGLIEEISDKELKDQLSAEIESIVYSVSEW